MRLIVVGPGRVGLSLAADLAGAGLLDRLLVVGPRPDAPPFLRRHAPGALYAFPAPGREPGPEARPSGAPAGADALALLGETPRNRPSEAALLFAVPDGAVAAAAAAWASALERANLPAPGVALHTSGLLPAAELAPLAGVGASVGSWHPLVALAGPRLGAFRGLTVGVEGEPAAVALGERIADAVGARPVRVRGGEKARWHAAAVLASNCLLACLSAAAREASAASDGGAEIDDLLPLARSALDEVADHGLTEGLTGPVARGDAAAVARHLDALDPGAAALYRPLAVELLRLAAPRLDAEAARALRAALGGRTAAERGGSGRAGSG